MQVSEFSVSAAYGVEGMFIVIQGGHRQTHVGRQEQDADAMSWLASHSTDAVPVNSRTVGALPSNVDLIVLGSGAGGLTAALTAQLAGMQCLLLERQQVIGGTSARSSGTVWVPGIARWREAGQTGDRAEAETYLEALVAGRGGRDIWLAFLDAAPHMQSNLEDRAGIVLAPFASAPDYRQDLPGAAHGWRAMEPAEFDGRKLGADFPALAWPLRELMLFGGMMIKRAEAQKALYAPYSPKSMAMLARLGARYARDRARWSRGTRLVMGNALIARLLYCALEAGVIVRRGVATEALTTSDDTVTGVRIRSGETIRASRGVVLAGGGFPASAEWREREMPDPTPEYTPASEGCTGRTIELGMAAGGALGPSLQDNALGFQARSARAWTGRRPSIRISCWIAPSRGRSWSIAPGGALQMKQFPIMNSCERCTARTSRPRRYPPG